MSIKKFKIFTWDRILIYGGINTFIAIIEAFAIKYNYFAHDYGIPLPGILTMILTLGASIGFSAILFIDRFKFKEKIYGYTQAGTGIMPINSMLGPQNTKNYMADLNNAQTEVINFWANSGLKISPLISMNYMNGGLCGFQTAPIDLTNHPPTGPMLIPPGFTQFAVGVTHGNSCCIQYTGDWDNSMRAFKHEMGHVCLNAANQGNEIDLGASQHALMAQYHFGF